LVVPIISIDINKHNETHTGIAFTAYELFESY